ncbi:MAG: SURF1 family protein [Propionivibrio sp.]|uniref:SURF1 family protein n=1 Tax=Propionivibrio sp. TaxID=2212460 RepID=UPI001A43807B|nr:SURF1 family protein [Propionivibrio sp.]MBL8414658.1 SURF1 family protein [Propionivibrio sp.]
MVESNKVSANYARTTEVTATPPTQEDTKKNSERRFQPRLLPTLAAALLLPLFISAGQWQWNKASIKGKLQKELDARGAEPAIQIPTSLVDPQALRYRKIVARGQYDVQHQILIDNRTHREQAGYHVLTPLRLEGSDMRLLVNRGWVPALAEHNQVPQVATPTGTVEVSGTAVVPNTRFITLGADDVNNKIEWQSVWQNLDLGRFGKAVNFPLQPIVIELDAASTAGGFVREWRRPDERLETHLGYALQWWSFAAITVVLWLVVNFRRTS